MGNTSKNGARAGGARRPVRPGGLGALGALGRSMAKSFAMASERALKRYFEGAWSGEERREGPRRGFQAGGAVLKNEQGSGDRRAMRDRRNDSNMIRLNPRESRQAMPLPEQTGWA